MLRTITVILQADKIITKMNYKVQIHIYIENNTRTHETHRVTNTGSFSIDWAFAIPMKKTPQPDNEGDQVNKKRIYKNQPILLQEIPASPLTATISANATGEAGLPLHPHTFLGSPWPWSK